MSPLPWQKYVSEPFWRAQFNGSPPEPQHGPKKLPTPPNAAPAEAAPAAEKDLLAEAPEAQLGERYYKSMPTLTLSLPSPRPSSC